LNDLEKRSVGPVATGWTSDRPEKPNHGTRTRCWLSRAKCLWLRSHRSVLSWKKSSQNGSQKRLNHSHG